MNIRLFVGGIPYEASQEELAGLFRTCGTVRSVKILVERETGRSRGIGFVEMSTDAEARAAIAKLNGAALRSRKIFVSEARPQDERPGASGGPSGGPGFVERRSGRDRRRSGNAPAGPDARRAERPAPWRGERKAPWSREERPAPWRPEGKAPWRPEGKAPWRPERKAPWRPEGKAPWRPEGKAPKKWGDKPSFPAKKPWSAKPGTGKDERPKPGGPGGKKKWGPGGPVGGPKWSGKPKRFGARLGWRNAGK